MGFLFLFFFFPALELLLLLSSAVLENQGQHGLVEGESHWEGTVYGAQEGSLAEKGWLLRGRNQTTVSGCVYLMALILYLIPSFEDFNNRVCLVFLNCDI